jgi:phage baseplate assembly protein W
MTDSTGANAISGRPLSDWEHVQQSIAKILTTPIGSRVMRRDFGSNLPDLIDSKMISQNILAVYASVAQAIDRWEPRFRVTKARIDRITPTGILALAIFGTYYPRGHKGDYSVAEDGVVRVVLGGEAT